MDIIRNINKSRYVLKKHLGDEWDVSVIQDVSDKEVEVMYNTKAPKNALFAATGRALGCNISLQNRRLKGHYLHILYFGFPKLGDNPTKITKTCADKLRAFYDSDVINKEDSLFVIISQPVSETITVAIDSLFKEGQHELLQGICEDLKSENSQLEETERYSTRHFRNIHIVQLEHLAVDVTLHELVPIHECIRGEPQIADILQECNASRNQLPIIKRNDPQAKMMRMAPGDICRIKRRTESGYVTAYRVCQ